MALMTSTSFILTGEGKLYGRGINHNSILGNGVGAFIYDDSDSSEDYDSCGSYIEKSDRESDKKSDEESDIETGYLLVEEFTPMM
jgi:hypothetical protein